MALMVSSLKNKLRHLGERLGYVGEVPDFHETICVEVSFNLHRVSNNGSIMGKRYTNSLKQVYLHLSI